MKEEQLTKSTRVNEKKLSLIQKQNLHQIKQPSMTTMTCGATFDRIAFNRAFMLIIFQIDPWSTFKLEHKKSTRLLSESKVYFSFLEPSSAGGPILELILSGRGDGRRAGFDCCWVPSSTLELGGLKAVTFSKCFRVVTEDLFLSKTIGLSSAPIETFFPSAAMLTSKHH